MPLATWQHACGTRAGRAYLIHVMRTSIVGASHLQHGKPRPKLPESVRLNDIPCVPWVVVQEHLRVTCCITWATHDSCRRGQNIGILAGFSNLAC